MKPTPTPEMIEAALAATDFANSAASRKWMQSALSAALSVQPAAAVVGERDGWKLVPIEPTDALLRSMAIRYDHGLGIPGYYDQPSLGGNHARRMEVAMSNMRQLYEEVVGKGFYRAPPAPEGWHPAMEKVFAAEAEFRSIMPDDWQLDPLAEAIAELRALYSSDKGSEKK